MSDERADHHFRVAALAYVVYGIVYWIGGMWLLSQGVGVMGGRTGASPASSMVRWGAIGLIPLVVVPWLLSRRWSWLGGIVSRRTFAWLLVVLLAFRAWKVSHVALQPDGATVAAPWGGALTFQAGAIAFLAVTLAALVAVARAGLTGARVGSHA